MDIGFRVDTNEAFIIEHRDSKYPEVFSLKYKKYSFALNAPIEFLQGMQGHPEVFLECVRRKHYPERPSRLNSIFLFQDLKTAKRFREMGWMEKDGLISSHKVEELYSEIFFGDMSLVNFIGNLEKNWNSFSLKKHFCIKNSLKESQEFAARCYWEGKTLIDVGIPPDNSIIEVLINGRVEMLNHNPLLDPVQ